MIIGRAEEIKILQNALNSEESEFIAVYGRRRVGKTYLIREARSSSRFNTQVSPRLTKRRNCQGSTNRCNCTD